MAKLKWSDLEKPLSPNVMEVIESFGFKKMTPVQVGFCPEKNILPRYESHNEINIQFVFIVGYNSVVDVVQRCGSRSSNGFR